MLLLLISLSVACIVGCKNNDNHNNGDAINELPSFEEFILDYTLPDMFYNCAPIGKAYIDGDHIVHHASSIVEATEDYPAIRKDYTYHFNKETKLLEKVTCVRYNDKNVITENNSVEFSYDVNADSLFNEKLIDKVYNSENRIDLEIVFGENEKYVVS